MTKSIDGDAGAASPTGWVKLVGAGPGAADLLTLRAVKAISVADVVLYDALVGDDVLETARPEARLICVGKRGHRGSVPQDFTNHLMVRLAHEGLNVVRLKGGDPSIFGRSAEERCFLEARGISVEVVPGITTASAAAAQFGFSLTERLNARRVLFATGRTALGAAGNWASAADPEATLCLYMACADIADIASQLLAAGRCPKTPALLIVNVERPGASLIDCKLATLSTQALGAAAGAPVLIVIGEAARAARACLVHADVGAERATTAAKTARKLAAM